jgi:hypothetical protein
MSWFGAPSPKKKATPRRTSSDDTSSVASSGRSKERSRRPKLDRISAGLPAADIASPIQQGTPTSLGQALSFLRFFQENPAELAKTPSADIALFVKGIADTVEEHVDDGETRHEPFQQDDGYATFYCATLRTVRRATENPGAASRLWEDYASDFRPWTAELITEPSERTAVNAYLQKHGLDSPENLLPEEELSDIAEGSRENSPAREAPSTPTPFVVPDKDREYRFGITPPGYKDDPSYIPDTPE